MNLDEIVLAKPKIYVPPRFVDTSEYQKKETIVIKIPFRGFPHPTAVWSKDGVKIEQGGHFQMETQERYAILTIKDAKKEDSGPYRLVVENELGTDSCIIKILVCGKLTECFKLNATHRDK